MKVKRFTIAIHLLICLLLLVVPYASTDQVFKSIEPASDLKYFLFCLLLSATLIISFYVNYLFLIPRYLLNGKYGIYFLFLLVAIITVFSISGFTFIISDFNNKTLINFNPIIEKIIPVIIINAIALWLL